MQRFSALITDICNVTLISDAAAAKEKKLFSFPVPGFASEIKVQLEVCLHDKLLNFFRRKKIDSDRLKSF